MTIYLKCRFHTAWVGTVQVCCFVYWSSASTATRTYPAMQMINYSLINLIRQYSDELATVNWVQFDKKVYCVESSNRILIVMVVVVVLVSPHKSHLFSQLFFSYFVKVREWESDHVHFIAKRIRVFTSCLLNFLHLVQKKYSCSRQKSTTLLGHRVALLYGGPIMSHQQQQFSWNIK